MTPQDALIALLTEYHLLDCLEQWDDVVREQVRDDGYTGNTSDHPRVIRFGEIRRTLGDAATGGRT